MALPGALVSVGPFFLSSSHLKQFFYSLPESSEDTLRDPPNKKHKSPVAKTTGLLC